MKKRFSEEQIVRILKEAEIYRRKWHIMVGRLWLVCTLASYVFISGRKVEPAPAQ